MLKDELAPAKELARMKDAGTAMTSGLLNNMERILETLVFGLPFVSVLSRKMRCLSNLAVAYDAAAVTARMATFSIEAVLVKCRPVAAEQVAAMAKNGAAESEAISFSKLPES